MGFVSIDAACDVVRGVGLLVFAVCSLVAVWRLHREAQTRDERLADRIQAAKWMLAEDDDHELYGV